ncbi:MAG: AmmeMemoRadiSam system protein B [Alphaproteobacteria bacterium]|nr:AmmeMemoRadiSam system protein B [Alphaproteobacteria bacterium]
MIFNINFLIILFSLLFIGNAEAVELKTNIRPMAVSGGFYPASHKKTISMVRKFLKEASLADKNAKIPKAIIAPHAGYVYSGAIAANIYARLIPAREKIKRVVIIGPSHRVPFRGIALSSKDGFATSGGVLPIDKAMVESLETLPNVIKFDAAHEKEHSLEVQLPFIREIFGDVKIVPIVTGNTTGKEVAAVLKKAWGGEETLIVISSDLSHFLNYDEALKIDALTAKKIENFEYNAIGSKEACGCIPIRGLLIEAQKRGMNVETVDVRNSGDIMGSKDCVVGYGAWAFTEKTKADSIEAKDLKLLEKYKETLLHIANASIRYGFKHKRPMPIKEIYPDELLETRAVFVTLEKNGRLRGCIGSIIARKPLLKDIADNAFSAAFLDRRFNELTVQEMEDIDISVSLLSKPVYMSFTDEEDFLSQLRPMRDGIIFRDGKHSSVYLPIVWEQLPEPRQFMSHLKIKAGLSPNHWSENVKIQRFTVNAIKLSDN